MLEFDDFELLLPVVGDAEFPEVGELLGGEEPPEAVDALAVVPLGGALLELMEPTTTPLAGVTGDVAP